MITAQLNTGIARNGDAHEAPTWEMACSGTEGWKVWNQTFTRKRDAGPWAKQIEVQAEHIVASGYQPVSDGYSVGNLIDRYARECNMGGRTKQAAYAMLERTNNWPW